MRLETFTCDKCEKVTPNNEMITSVEVAFGGHGAARDVINGIDLCRGCYGNLVSAIKEHTKASKPERTVTW